MPRASGRRQRSAAASLAVALVAGSSWTASAAPAPEPANPVAPVETPGLDPVLDVVEVVATSETRSAEADFRTTDLKRKVATLRYLGATTNHDEHIARRDGAVEAVKAAEEALSAAQKVLAAEELVLTAKKEEQREERAKLAVEQEALRRVGIGVYISAPLDDFAWLAEPDDMNASAKRDAVRERSVEQQISQVEAATVPWEAARAATATQQGIVDDATAVVDDAEEALATAIDERDHAADLLTLAEAQVTQRAEELATAADVAHDATVVRRKARLTALVDGTDLRLVALDAYWRAAGSAPCRIPWWVLAGVGRVETRHGTAHGSKLTAAGDTTVHILGIPLDGRPGVATIGDTDGGALDGDPTFDRAVGPMQFIPGTWGRWAKDGNADGKADPHNLYDAAAAAAAYLCFGRGELTTEGAIRGALFSYNLSVPYGDQVLAEGDGYRRALDLPDWPDPDALVAMPPED